MIAVDTSVWIDYLAGRDTDETLVLDRGDRRRRVIVGDIILLEILQGFREDRHLKAAERLLRRSPVAAMLGERRAAVAAARYRRLRRRGITIRKSADLIIGSWCIEEDVPLLYSDRDFEPLVEHEGLRKVV